MTVPPRGAATGVSRAIVATARRWFAGVGDLLYPPACEQCGADVGVGRLCSDCRRALLALADDPCCPRCASTLGPHVALSLDGCHWCRDRRLAFERAYRLGKYDEPLASACRRLKSWTGRRLGVALADLLGESRGGALAALGIDVVAPTPLHWTRRWSRGYDQSEALAERLAQGLDRPFLPKALVRWRRTADQRGLAPTARWENLRDAFRATGDARLKGARVLLVDDVMTTGATCHHAARALIAGGTKSVIVAVLARRDR